MVIAWSYFVEGKIKLKIYQTNCSCMLCPHNQHDADGKDEFYQQLQAAVQTVPTHDRLLILGNMNVRTGPDNRGKERYWEIWNGRTK